MLILDTMSLIKTINLVIKSFFLISIIGCSNSDDAKPLAENFFQKVISNKKHEAAKMIDPKATIYPNRLEFINNLKNNKEYGTLTSIGGGMYGSSTKTFSTFGYTRIELQIKLNYDSTSVFADVEVVDRGNDFMITKIKI